MPPQQETRLLAPQSQYGQVDTRKDISAGKRLQSACSLRSLALVASSLVRCCRFILQAGIVATQYNMIPDLTKPSLWDLRAIFATGVYSIWDGIPSKWRFRHR